MPESTETSKEADLVVEETTAILGLQLVCTDHGVEYFSKLAIAVSELALGTIFAYSDIDPVLAKLSLVLLLRINFLLVNRSCLKRLPKVLETVLMGHLEWIAWKKWLGNEFLWSKFPWHEISRNKISWLFEVRIWRKLRGLSPAFRLNLSERVVITSNRRLRKGG